MKLKPEWRVFVREINKHGDRAKAYLKAYPKVKSRAVAVNNAYRLMKHPQIQPLLKFVPEVFRKAQSQVLSEVTNEMFGDLLNAADKRAVLAKIARGEMEIPEHFIKRDGQVGKFMRKPNALEIIRAIEADNRMAGDDAPQKHEHGVEINSSITRVYKQAMAVKVVLDSSNQKS